MNDKISSFIDESNLSDEDKVSFRYLVSQINTGELNEFVDRSYIFEGDPGIGKTYFVKNFLSILNIPAIYLGPSSFAGDKIKQVKNLNQVLKDLDKDKLSVVFIDDLNNSLDFERTDFDLQLGDNERKRFLKLLEITKATDSKTLLFMTLNDSSFMEESWNDRIERKIKMEEPDEASKEVFLKEKYSSLISSSLINELANKSVGHNFRNLQEVIKICFRNSNGIIRKSTLIKVLSNYKPSGIKYEAVFNNKLNFSKVVGHEKVKKELMKLSYWVKNSKKLKKHGVKRSNLLIFSGKNGVGKTFMAHALAGENECLLVRLNVNDLFGGLGPLRTIADITKRAKRFKNCVFLIDEADKLFGGDPYQRDHEGPLLADLSMKFDDLLAKPSSIIIFTVNNVLRMGNAIKDRFNILEFKLPGIDDRKEFISRLTNKSNMKLVLDLEIIGKFTEGYNYRDLEKLWDDIVFYYSQNGYFNDDIFKELVSTQIKQTEKPSMFG